MTQLPMFYKNVEALSTVNHKRFQISAAAEPFAFAREAQVIPAVFDEFTAAAHDLPIVFVPTGTGFTPVFLCGLKSGENVFVDAEGKWTPGYMPAYLRRYPFILGEQEGADPIVCVDSGYAGFAESDSGTPLFDEAGEKTEFMDRVVRLVTEYAASAKRTEGALEVLKDLDLFSQISIEARDASGEVSASLHGFAVVDEEKLRALPDADYLKLREAGVLPAIYAHLLSVSLANKLARATADKTKAA
ncbi:SapC family protein [Maritimibacter sp. UBA3975]|uniref:SapC family protein n=1 Tax=Maritimibacter sp. UBA3975 TaxID=1946833 RepID=UPI000C091B29|nr:SapC family protein [Maritimibacter sp. UBA3975]MAM63009.1 SapC family protein [Maritimibacter sp.]|tara:strand:- start:2062 stop:2799 length:738 start_codon:yes stop_codon:yes gene_type:complete